MRMAVTIAACSALAILTLPVAAQDRPNLSGTWSAAGATWVINEDDSSIQITQSESAASKKIELKCTTDGKDCKIKDLKATASFWYNGPVLVEMESKGDHVTRYTMKLSEDGKTLTVDTTSIVPKSSQDDVAVFRKQV